MKFTTAAAVAASLASFGTEALQLKKRDDTAPRVVHFPLERRQNDRHVLSPRQLRKRQTISQTLDNFEQGSLYFANVTLGTPPQDFRFHVDTGSADLWTNAADSRLCRLGTVISDGYGDNSCDVSGTYEANSSSTYNFVSEDFTIDYADGTGARGDYVTDTLRFGDSELTDLQFGVGYQSSSTEGVMGIGFQNLEVQVIRNGEQPYSNIPLKMVEEGLVGTAAYSLWLDDLFSSTGSILFGGIDQNKYVGELKTLPVQRVQGQFLEMEVILDQIDLLDGDSNNTVMNQQATVLLDSGSTLSYLPERVAFTIYDTVGATYSNSAGVALCPCDLANSSTTLDFIFDGKVIEVRMEELVLPGGVGSPNSEVGCVFGIMPQEQGQSSGSSAEDESYTLGDTFIRNAYIVYDIQNGEISIAQTDFNSDSTDIMEIANSTELASIDGNGSNNGVNRGDDEDAASGLRPALTWTIVAVVGAVIALSM